jgi:hypothetical protein
MAENLLGSILEAKLLRPTQGTKTPQVAVPCRHGQAETTSTEDSLGAGGEATKATEDILGERWKEEVVAKEKAATKQGFNPIRSLNSIRQCFEVLFF